MKKVRSWFRKPKPVVDNVVYALTPEERGMFNGLVRAALAANGHVNTFLSEVIKRESVPADSVWDGQALVFRPKAAH